MTKATLTIHARRKGDEITDVRAFCSAVKGRIPRVDALALMARKDTRAIEEGVSVENMKTFNGYRTHEWFSVCNQYAVNVPDAMLKAWMSK